MTAVAEMLELGPHLDKTPDGLSGGQQQRVSLGRAIVRDPDVLLLDEPLSNLDARLRVVMRSELKRIQRRVGSTALYVTHDQVEAMTMGDRIVVMDAGQIAQMGTPAQVYLTPASLDRRPDHRQPGDEPVFRPRQRHKRHLVAVGRLLADRPERAGRRCADRPPARP